jgi:hypothetical protein
MLFPVSLSGFAGPLPRVAHVPRQQDPLGCTAIRAVVPAAFCVMPDRVSEEARPERCWPYREYP